jgi:hypothetical protein
LRESKNCEEINENNNDTTQQEEIEIFQEFLLLFFRESTKEPIQWQNN